MYLRYIKTAILTRERSEEEKLRRHLYGDKGAKFSDTDIAKSILFAIASTGIHLCIITK